MFDYFLELIINFFNFTWIIKFIQGLVFKNVKNETKNDFKEIIPESVNFHFTRQCNYSCKFKSRISIEELSIVNFYTDLNPSNESNIFYFS